MEILYSNSNDKIGNDCVICEDIALMLMRNYYMVLKSIKYTGWFGADDKTQVKVFDDYEEAKTYYDNLIEEI